MRSFTVMAITGVYILVAAMLCFTPLADVLGYEFALILGACTAIGSPIVGNTIALRAAPFSHHAIPRTSPAWRALGTVLAQLLVPLILIALNGVRVRNCNYLTGIGFFVGLPVLTSMYGALWGVTIGTLLGKHVLLRRAALVGVIIAPLAWTLWTLYTEPPIFAFDHVWGHFAGSLYDEVIRLDQRFLWFRTGTVLRIIGLLCIVHLIHRRRRVHPVLTGVISIAIFATCATYEKVVGPYAGFRITRADIQAHLPVIEKRAGIILHLPAHVTDEQRQAIGDDHAFRLDQIVTRLGIVHAQPIHSYVYATAADQARMTGGYAVMFAKPWLGEMHLHGLETPNQVMAHEMVHVIAAQFASKPLGVSARAGFFVNMGIVEGLAEALTPERDLLDVDHAARAMRDLKIAPDLTQLVGAAGFWKAPARRAYTVTGSFIRYLLNTRGPRALRDMYAHGDFETAYVTPLPTLIADWQRHLDTITITPRERHITEDRFRAPSIFQKTCAHEIATLRQHAQAANPAEAVAVYRTICSHLDNAPDAQIDLAFALQRSGDHKGFALLAKQILHDAKCTTAQAIRLQEALASHTLRDGDIAQAISMLRAIQELPITLDSERMQWIRIWALQQPTEWRTPLWQFLAGELDRPAAMVVLENMRAHYPGDKTVPYLIGRQLVTHRAWNLALPYLRAAEGHPFALIDAERLRLEAEALWRLHQHDAAEAAYALYAERAPISGERARAIDAISRIHWETTQIRD